jgi:hypothetical protein
MLEPGVPCQRIVVVPVSGGPIAGIPSAGIPTVPVRVYSTSTWSALAADASIVITHEASRGTVRFFNLIVFSLFGDRPSALLASAIKPF